MRDLRTIATDVAVAWCNVLFGEETLGAQGTLLDGGQYPLRGGGMSKRCPLYRI